MASGSSGSPPRSTGSRRGTPGSLSATATTAPPSWRASTACPASPCPTPTARSRSASPPRSLDGDPSTPDGLLAALAGPRELITGRASFYVRLLTPVAKLVQRARGNGRVARRRPVRAGERAGGGRCQRRGRRRAPERRRRRSGDDRLDRAAATLERPRGRAPERPTAQRRTAIASRRPAVARPPAPPAADDHLARPAARPARPVRAGLPGLQARGAAGQDRCRRTRCCSSRRSWSSTSASRSAACAGRSWSAGRGFRLTVRDATEIIFLVWLVNCLVPAKLGDVYRAYLLKINSPVSLSRTFGTVFIERILDLFAIVVLGLAAGFGRSGAACRPTSRSCSRSASPSCVVLAGGLLTMRNFGRRIIIAAAAAAPRPRVLRPLRGGRVRARSGCGRCRGWSSSPASSGRPRRCACSSSSRRSGFPDVHLGISGAFFVALTGSLLTAVPLTPAGIGFVETGVVGAADARLRRAARPRPWRSRSSIARSASSRSSSSARSPTALSPKRRGQGVVEGARPGSTA